MMTRRSRSLVQASACASKLKSLADPTRLAVVEALMDGPKHAGALQERLKVEQTLLSHHLQNLREANLVVAKRDGKAVLYRLAPGVAARRGESAIDLGCCMLSFS
jgi:ArsR family transcriptional regulator